MKMVMSQFQSTHPQGVGPSRHHPSSRWLSNFNPPTRKGWDLRGCTYLQLILDFNPPTRKGWDYLDLTIDQDEAVFQSTHPQGVGPGWIPRKALPRYFNPPTRKGWDSKSSQNKLRILYKINKNSVAIQLVSNSFQFLFSNCLLFSAFFRCEPCVLFLLTPPSHC